MAVSPDDFRKAMGSFASAVTVVTTRGADDQLYGITVTAFSSVSLHPPLVLICIDARAAIHNILTPGMHFAVNILAEDQQHLSQKFASRDIDRFAGVEHDPGLGDVPLLAGTAATIECKITATLPGGDHSIIVGEVESTTVSDHKPLLYFRGKYGRVESAT